MPGILEADVTALLQDMAPLELATAVTDELKATPNKPSVFGIATKTDEVSGADGPHWAAEVEGYGNVTWYGEDDAFPAPDKQDEELAELGWGSVVVTMKMTGHARDAIRAGTLKISMWAANQMNSARAHLIDAIEGLLHANDPAGGGSNEANGLTGLDVAIGADDNTYAGIDRSTFALWAPVVNAPGSGQDLTIALMESVMDELEDTHGVTDWDLILTSQTQYRNYLDLRGDTGAPSEQITRNFPAGDVFSVGFTTAEFYGRPVIPVKGFPTDRMYFVRARDIVIEFIRQFEVGDVEKANDNWYWHITARMQLKYVDPHAAAYLGDLNT
jgi:hypothetical protein